MGITVLNTKEEQEFFATTLTQKTDALTIEAAFRKDIELFSPDEDRVKQNAIAWGQFKASMQKGDELWLYNDKRSLIGSRGVGIKRGNLVVSVFVLYYA